ncbi:MAG: hypothetical protein WC465_00180 [Patescibacteria group bacterium]
MAVPIPPPDTSQTTSLIEILKQLVGLILGLLGGITIESTLHISQKIINKNRINSKSKTGDHSPVTNVGVTGNDNQVTVNTNNGLDNNDQIDQEKLFIGNEIDKILIYRKINLFFSPWYRQAYVQLNKHLVCASAAEFARAFSIIKGIFLDQNTYDGVFDQEALSMMEHSFNEIDKFVIDQSSDEKLLCGIIKNFEAAFFRLKKNINYEPDRVT